MPFIVVLVMAFICYIYSSYIEPEKERERREAIERNAEALNQRRKEAIERKQREIIEEAERNIKALNQRRREAIEMRKIDRIIEGKTEERKREMERRKENAIT